MEPVFIEKGPVKVNPAQGVWIGGSIDSRLPPVRLIYAKFRLVERDAWDRARIELHVVPGHSLTLRIRRPDVSRSRTLELTYECRLLVLVDPKYSLPEAPVTDDNAEALATRKLADHTL